MSQQNDASLKGVFLTEAAKLNAQKKTENALHDLKAKQRDCELKLTDLQRRIDDTTEEVKALLQKGQRDKAKLVLRKKTLLGKQVTSVQNVCYLSVNHCQSMICFKHWSWPSTAALLSLILSDTNSTNHFNTHFITELNSACLSRLSFVRSSCQANPLCGCSCSHSPDSNLD